MSIPSIRSLISLLEGSLRDLNEVRDRHQGDYDEDSARSIGDCAIIAIATATGLPWEDVWSAARPYFTRHGMDSGGISATVRALGWSLSGYYTMPWVKGKGMTVRQAEEWLRRNDPDARLICTIDVNRMGHSIAFRDGQFHNTQGAYRAKLQLVYSLNRLTA